MTLDEKRIWLIRRLQKETPEYADFEIPEDPDLQRRLLRGLFNVRKSAPTSEEFLKIEGEYLREITREKGVADVDDLKPCLLDPRLYLWRGDITTLKCDAIVNAANSGMTGCYLPNHHCIDNNEHTFAGLEMRLECWRYMRERARIYGEDYEEPTGRAVITGGYNLPAKRVIHTVGPIVRGRLTNKEREQLASCYRSVLEKADENRIESLAFCCVSTGVFRFPQDKARDIAVKTTREWLDAHPKTSVKKAVFDVFTDVDLELYDQVLNCGVPRGGRLS